MPNLLNGRCCVRWVMMALVSVFILVAYTIGGERGKTDRIEASGANEAIVSGSGQVAEVLALLDQMPDWPSVSLAGYPKDRTTTDALLRKIEVCVYRIARYDLDTIRTAVELYQKRAYVSGRGIRDLEKLFFLNTYLFNFPETVRRDSRHFPHFLTGWRGMPITGDPNRPANSDRAYVRWPWREAADGKLHFMPAEVIIYMGPPYQATKAFDYFRKEFGRRAGPVSGND